jgi:hypothetical protein
MRLLLASMLSSFLTTTSAAVALADEAPAAPQSFHAQVVDVEGAPHVAFPEYEAEYLLWVLSVQVPKLKELSQAQDKLVDIRAEQVRTATRALEVSESVLQDQKRLTEGWKAAALAAETSWWEDLFESKELWLITGLVAGGALVKWLGD